MQKYHNTIQDRAGNIINTATVTVYDAGTLDVAAIFEDDESTPLTNPFTSSHSNYADDGSFWFNAANGNYDISIDDDSFDAKVLDEVTLFDVADAPTSVSSFDALTDTNPTLKADSDFIIWDADTGKYINATAAALDIASASAVQTVLNTCLKKDGSVDSTGDQQFTGFVGIGGEINTNYALNITRTFSDTTVQKIGGNCILSLDGTNTATQHLGMSFGVSTAGVADYPELIGGYFAPSHQSSGVAQRLVGAASFIYNGGGGNVEQGRVFEAKALTVFSPMDFITSFYSANVVSAGSTIGVQSAAWYEKCTKGAQNYGLVLDGDGVGSDLVLGANQDVKISSIGGTLKMTGISASAQADAPIIGHIIVNINGTNRKLAYVA